MSQDLLSIIQQVIVAVGTVVVLAVATAVGRRLSRLLGTVTGKAFWGRRMTVDLGAVHIAIVVTIGARPQGPKSLPAARGDELDS